MTRTKPASARARGLTTAGLFAISLAGGFAAVYFSLPAGGSVPAVRGVAGQSGDVRQDSAARSSVHAGGETRVSAATGTAQSETAEKARTSRFDALLTGDMVKFVPVARQPKPAADYTTLSFNTADGTAVTLGDWNGRVVLVNLWATWCAPCIHEMPSLDRLKAELGGENFDVVAVSIDRANVAKVKTFLERHTPSGQLSLYHDPSGKVRTALGARGLPTTVLVGRNGKELGRLIGPADWAAPEAVALMKKAVAEGS